jgi:hypothetical protein
MDEIEHLEARAANAVGDEAKAEALYQLASSHLRVERARLLQPGGVARQALLLYLLRPAVPRARRGQLMRRYMEEHEPSCARSASTCKSRRTTRARAPRATRSTRPPSSTSDSSTSSSTGPTNTARGSTRATRSSRSKTCGARTRTTDCPQALTVGSPRRARSTATRRGPRRRSRNS